MQMALENRNYEKFAQEYAVHGNSRKAAVVIGLRPASGSAVLARPEVRKRVDALVDDQFAQANVGAARVFKELARIAFFDPRGISDEYGNLLPIHELDDDTAAAIAQIKVEVVGRGAGEDREMVVVKHYKEVDKMAALTVLAKHYKIIGDADDGVNVLANALADRLTTAKRRENAAQDAQDARIVDRAAGGGVSLTYAVPDDPSNANDVTNLRLRAGTRDAESLHFDLPGPEAVERAAPTLHSAALTASSGPGAPEPTFGVQPAAPSAPLGDDDEIW